MFILRLESSREICRGESEQLMGRRARNHCFYDSKMTTLICDHGDLTSSGLSCGERQRRRADLRLRVLVLS